MDRREQEKGKGRRIFPTFGGREREALIGASQSLRNGLNLSSLEGINFTCRLKIHGLSIRSRSIKRRREHRKGSSQVMPQSQELGFVEGLRIFILGADSCIP